MHAARPAGAGDTLRLLGLDQLHPEFGIPLHVRGAAGRPRLAGVARCASS